MPVGKEAKIVELKKEGGRSLRKKTLDGYRSQVQDCSRSSPIFRNVPTCLVHSNHSQQLLKIVFLSFSTCLSAFNSFNNLVLLSLSTFDDTANTFKINSTRSQIISAKIINFSTYQQLNSPKPAPGKFYVATSNPNVCNKEKSITTSLSAKQQNQISGSARHLQLSIKCMLLVDINQL